MIALANYAAKVDAPTGDPEDIAWAQQDFGNSLYTVRCSRDALSKHRDKIPGLSNKGVYVLIGPISTTGLRRIYIGHARELGKRLDSHLRKKDFWTHCVFVTSTHNVLHEGHIERVEALLIAQARELAGVDSSENSAVPADRSATNDVERAAVMIIREFQLHLSILGMNYTRWSPAPPQANGPIDPEITSNITATEPVGVKEVSQTTEINGPTNHSSEGLPDTLIVPAHEGGFSETFLEEQCWYRIRVAEKTIPQIRYIAAYIAAPVRAITHYARVARIDTLDESGKKIVVFDGPPIRINPIVPDPDNFVTIQSPRLAYSQNLFKAETLPELFAQPPRDGHEAPKESPANQHEDRRLYKIKARSITAAALISPSGIWIQPGSCMAPEAMPSLGKSTQRIREELLDSDKVRQENGVYVFQEEVFFKRPSGASSLILGQSTNGYEYWKDESGKPLGDALQPENFRDGTWIDERKATE